MNKIKILRTNKGISQAEISFILGIDKSTVSKWETGESMPRAERLVQLSKILDCTVEELLEME